MSKRKTPPKRIYLEVWPIGSGNTDQVHYGPTGYGIDIRSGATSVIYTYERVTARGLKARKQKVKP